MTAVWILLGLAVLLALLLLSSLTIYVRVQENVTIQVGMLGFRWEISLSEKKESDSQKKKAKSIFQKSKKPKKKKSAEELAGKKHKLTEKPSEKTLGETVDFVLTLIQSILPGAIGMLSHLRFTSVRIYLTVAGEEADQTALAYGAVSAGVYMLLGALDSGFSLRLKSVDVIPDFVTGEAVYDICFKVKLRNIRILFGVVEIIFNLMGNLRKNVSLRQEKAPRTSPNQR